MTLAPPGSDRTPELTARLEAALAARGPDHVPRTHLHDGDVPRYVNRLILESAPYLLQHAHNPVDWRPWSDETLAEAAARDLPIFLSAGYATCHWCHVMEEESFDDEEVAALLNGGFIPVKLDRESRPDIDHVYISATSLQNGHAGWPNSCWLMPDGRPFHTGTYFPKPQFMQLLRAISAGWNGSGREEFERVAGKLSDAISRITATVSDPVPLEDAPDRALAQLARMHNGDEGGFSRSNQFPQEGFLLFLLDHWRRTGDASALGMARHSLAAMAAGGLQDQVGGGFHRYTVDANWRTPHFEKMLYNQALLTRCYTQIHEIDRSGGHEVNACIRYVAEEMTAPDGAFYAAEDADSPDATGRLEEGAFYAWTPEEVHRLLDPAAAARAVAMLGLDRPATLEAGAVAHRPAEHEVPPDLWAPDELPILLRRLHDFRARRPRPLRDEKIIAGWNGLMIRALAEAALSFHNPDWCALAARAAEAVLARLDTPGGLMRIHAGGAAAEPAQLSDYAWLGLGCLALADATGDTAWGDRAEDLCRRMIARFDDGRGRLACGFGPGPFARIYETEDGAVPSGESSALELMARLARRRPAADLALRAAALRDALSQRISEYPAIWPTGLVACRILAAGESETLQVHEEGTLRTRLECYPGSDARRLVVNVAPGWHVAAPGAEGLVPARLEGAETTWPEPVLRASDGQDAPVPAYEGSFTLPLAAAGPEIFLTLQPCSEALCRRPVTIRYRLS